MFSLVCACAAVPLCVCVFLCPGLSCCGYPGASSTRSHNRPEFINVVHFLSSVGLWLADCAALQSNIPHTPLELRERPAVKQRPSSGMSLLSQGERMEGGREQEVRLEGPNAVRLATARLLEVARVSIIKALITTHSCGDWLALPRSACQWPNQNGLESNFRAAAF